MTVTNINGIDIHYETSGAGPPIVWLHGLMGSIERSRKFGEGMDGIVQHGYRLSTYDARGHGESGDSEGPSDSAYSRDAHANDMLDLLDHLNVERAIIGGGSMGASVSIAFALANPKRVDKLVLVAPPPLADTIGPAQQTFGGLATLIEQIGLEPAVDIVMQLPMYKEMLGNDPAQYELMRGWYLSQHPGRRRVRDSRYPLRAVGPRRALRRDHMPDAHCRPAGRSGPSDANRGETARSDY